MSDYSEEDIIARLHGRDNVAPMRTPFTQEILLARLAALVADSAL